MRNAVALLVILTFVVSMLNGGRPRQRDIGTAANLTALGTTYLLSLLEVKHLIDMTTPSRDATTVPWALSTLVRLQPQQASWEVIKLLVRVANALL
jgi:NADH:ubiquinone oxidoreductase subunit 6 (subunit J)